MTDPFQDVDSTDSEFVAIVVAALESRAAEDHMIPIVEQYLDRLNWLDGATHIEVGAGTGPIARRMAARANSGRIIAIDPSEKLIVSARELADDLSNIEFEVGDGSALRFAAGSIDSVVMHTVLSHVPEPKILLIEAMRVLKAGGKLVICDADFEKSFLGNFEGDPLNACAKYFVQNFVTQPYLISNIRRIATSVGFKIDEFRVDSRTITDTDGGLGWIKMGTKQMVERGLIGEELADALASEYIRRKEDGVLYGHQPFGTLVATKPE
ncbi:methyltransferase domain-containing protein [Granulosicoccus antarcticus]|uniref:Demethylmenaquinone methyltransferase n=1 Tax=Granulosicoccus antarcticus IMCC3135 TaxID=1192854 RepID=A0A2Z2NUW5_9GAMM|nr:methyltransferase domain-containing protein [Granulosicoccus antarcticus]ASJ73518.1 Demethylmenaquinone methyltransferase [Granulosicoccus antarcticus IMCC3135]